MAIELPARRIREIAVADPVLRPPQTNAVAVPVPKGPSTLDFQPLTIRALEVLPGAVALFLITSFLWGFVLFPTALAFVVLAFDTYWLWKSWTIAFHAVKGARLLRKNACRNWFAEYRAIARRGGSVLPWEAVQHVVIIPNYKESEAKLHSTLRTLARAKGARRTIIPVLAMEGAEPDCRRKAKSLKKHFARYFREVLITVHPSGLPGEVRGKSSNESWAAKRAVEHLVGKHGRNLDHLTVTSCDADTQFPQSYFEALTFHFTTDPKRYRRFWQAPIFFYNNIWQVPGPLRVPNALSGLVHLGRLSRKRRVLFSQSTYSLSMRMAHEAGYWDTDIIPEDWHMFLKCYYQLGGEVDVEPMFLPVGNDAALSTTPLRTYVNHYLQVRRWGWGASDVPYAIVQSALHPEIPLRRRLLRFWYFFDNHISWSTQWFFLTLGGMVPMFAGYGFGINLTPDFFFLQNITGWSVIPGWMTLTSLVMTPCLVPFFLLILIDAHLRPPAPAHFSRLYRSLSYCWWLATSPITFFCSALPALDAQVRLMLGKRMEYRVTEKV